MHSRGSFPMPDDDAPRLSPLSPERVIAAYERSIERKQREMISAGYGEARRLQNEIRSLRAGIREEEAKIQERQQP
jgi:hypothetical protein